MKRQIRYSKKGGCINSIKNTFDRKTPSWVKGAEKEKAKAKVLEEKIG